MNIKEELFKVLLMYRVCTFRYACERIIVLVEDRNTGSSAEQECGFDEQDICKAIAWCNENIDKPF